MSHDPDPTPEHHGLGPVQGRRLPVAILAAVIRVARGWYMVARHHGFTRLEMFHNRAKKRWLDVIPINVIGLCDRYEIISEKYACHAIHGKHALRQR